MQSALEHEDTKLLRSVAGFFISGKFLLSSCNLLIIVSLSGTLMYFACLFQPPPSLTLWLIVPRGWNKESCIPVKLLILLRESFDCGEIIMKNIYRKFFLIFGYIEQKSLLEIRLIMSNTIRNIIRDNVHFQEVLEIQNYENFPSSLLAHNRVI
jgi:hypothetical protein